MQRHHLPLVVEHRRTGGARVGVGLVMDEQLQFIHHLVVADGQLLGLAIGVLDDVHRLPHQQLALVLDQRQPAAGGQAWLRCHRHQGIVELLVAEEQLLGGEVHHRAGLDRTAGVFLVVELHRGAARRSSRVQHVLVGEQQPRTHQEAGAVAQRAAATVTDVDPSHRPGHPQSLLKEAHPHQVVGVQHPLHGAGELLRAAPRALGIKGHTAVLEVEHEIGDGMQPQHALAHQLGGIGGDRQDLPAPDRAEVALALLVALPVARFRGADRTDDGHRASWGADPSG